MAHHYDGYDVTTLWTSEHVAQISAVQGAIKAIEGLDSADTIPNQEILKGLRSVLKDLRNNRQYYKGEF
jgi:hypothetical protein